MEIKEVSSEFVQEKYKNKESFFLIDVRSDSEWQAQHIEYAIHLPLDQISADNVNKLIPNKNSCVILHCRAGVRSLTAAEKFIDLGYTNVFSMIGGIESWYFS